MPTVMTSLITPLNIAFLLFGQIRHRGREQNKHTVSQVVYSLVVEGLGTWQSSSREDIHAWRPSKQSLEGIRILLILVNVVFFFLFLFFNIVVVLIDSCVRVCYIFPAIISVFTLRLGLAVLACRNQLVQCIRDNISKTM